MNTTLEAFEAASGSSRSVALLRRAYLEEDAEGKQGTGLANEVVACLQESLSASNTGTNNDSGAQPDALRVVTMIQNLTDQDTTLFEEVACSENFSTCLDELVEGRDDDARLQTIVAALQKNMSALETKDRNEPFGEKELQSRLPLSFDLPISDDTIDQDNLNIMVHQVTSEKETDTHDVGNVMWPASVMLARHITENPSIVLGNSDGCLELGAGCGLVGLTAATLLKQSREKEEKEGQTEEEEGKYADNDVIFTDYLPQVLENIERNLDLNDIENCSVSGLDFFDQPGNYDSEYLASQPNWIDMDGTERKQVGLVLAADVICYSNDATNVANTIFSALVDDGRAVVVSAADGRRFGVEEFPGALRDAGLDVHVTKFAADDGLTTTVEESQDAELFACVGYCAEGYNFLRFDITKPSSE